ncbi:MAG: hypothetical protein M1820_003646 [Bogoriella megaspora]|nr:MAG: hypothetical protein M1820_003646 [Bogoriella megaspora]
MPSVLVLGAASFVGGAIVEAIQRAHPSWQITAFVSSDDLYDDLESELGGAKIVEGEVDEAEKIAKLSIEHDVVVNATVRHRRELISAIIEGSSKKSGKVKLIHISGGRKFVDGGQSGDFNPESKVWSDDSIDDIKASTKEGSSDAVVMDAGKNGQLETYIVAPGFIYGNAAVRSSVVKNGYWFLVSMAQGLGHLEYIGSGSALISAVHVVDVADFIVKLIDLAVSGPPDGSVYERFYIVENSAVSWKALQTEFAKVLYRKGVITSPVAESISFEKANGYHRSCRILGANMLMKGPRGIRMGFKATHRDILEQIDEDIDQFDIGDMVSQRSLQWLA